jgi:hypothetical protein
MTKNWQLTREGTLEYQEFHRKIDFYELCIQLISNKQAEARKPERALALSVFSLAQTNK